MPMHPREPYVPVPVGRGYCVEHRANVAIGADGRCPEHQTLAIWPGDEPRPDIRTESYLTLLDAARIDPSSEQGRHRMPLNVRQRRSLAR